MTNSERAQILGRPILLYDGVCVLCNGFVRFTLDHDKQAIVLFTPLQGSLGGELLSPAQPDSPANLDGVVLITNTLSPAQQIFRRSDAVAQLLQLLGGPWRIIGKLLALIPRSLREVGYGIVARLRYRLFGRYDTCPIPTPEQRARILGLIL
jgi:predicted DCC family thiol-disulfide oxidoreductase YuxK